MRRAPILLAGAGVLALAVALGVHLRHAEPPHYTGFVEGEERVIRSEVSGRVLAVPYAEGAAVPPDAVVAELDDQDIQSRLRSKEQQLGVLDAERRVQAERIRLVETTWPYDRDARQADVRQAESALALAERSLAREHGLTGSGATTPQRLDDRHADRDQAQSRLDRARQMAARADAEEHTITLAHRELEALEQKRALADAEREELRVTAARYQIRAPGTATVVQTQLIWPGELAQPGTAIVALLDPFDKYVQVYVPVPDVARFRIGRRVEIELDSTPGHRVPGEVSFVADQATFTPEKIETRSDRLGQVYRAKVRILAEVERFQPGTEGNVYLGPEGEAP